MRRIALLVLLAVLLVVPATAAARTRSLSIDTARLYRHKVTKQLQRQLPRWTFVQAYPDGPPCQRQSRTAIICGITGRRTYNDGITEQIVYTVHVRNYSDGWTRVRTTYTGPTEVS